MNPAPSLSLIDIWYRTHHHWLVSRFKRQLHCAHQAADFAQDTFVRVMQRPPQDSVIEPRAYLSTIAHSLLVNYWRRLELERSYLSALQTQEQTLVPDQERRLIALAELETLAEMLAGLPDRQSNIFLLARLDGYSHAEIAQHLNISLSTVQKDLLKVMQHCYALKHGQPQ